MTDPRPPTAPAPVADPSGASARDVATGTLAGLLEEIAASRADILRREEAAHELERRLRTDLAGLEAQWVGLRVQTFRALGRRLRDGSLGRKAGRVLAAALGALADELESEYGADLRTDRRLYLGEDAEEEEEEEDAEPARHRGRKPARKPAASDPADTSDPSGTFDASDASEGAAPAGHRAGTSEGASGRTATNAARRREARDRALVGDIRALYLILARALHPDKEANPALRDAKTAWMQKVTAAYARKDLAMLLDILAHNPLEAVGPYLAAAPPATVRGFAKRLRRELADLRRQSAKAGEWLHPSLARFLKDGAIDEARYAGHLGELRRAVRLARQRLETYRSPEGAEFLVEGLRKHDWRDLL
jgi:hypothetical protein